MRSTTGKTYKVVVWATGGVGRYAIRTAADRPNLELVGAWVYSATKDGQDIGTLAGIEPVGVTATRDVDALLSGDADCIMYAAPAGPRPKEALADFCRILTAGKNIVTTSLPGLVYEKGSLSERYLEPIREACRAGNSSIYSSGIEPGFGCDLFPIALLSMSHRVYSVRGIEITNYS
ncbi:MAG: dihydrodipicolinate reductase, partial [Mycobacterium sp.]